MTASISHQSVGDGLAASQPSQQMVTELEQLVEHGRVRWRRLILIEAVSLAVAAPLAYLWGVFLLDNVLHLPAWALVAANVAFVVCVVWAVRKLLQSWRRARFTTDQVALAIEQRTPGGLENRLINALQLSRGEAASGESAMTEAVVGENYRVLKQMRLQQSTESRPVVIRATVALLLVALGVGFWVGSTERFTTSAGRLFMPLAGIEPVYRTRLAVEPGDVTVRAGQDVTLEVEVEGRVPEHVRLLVDAGDRQAAHELPVDPETNTARYTFAAVQGNMTYQLRGGDFRTPQFAITVPAELQLHALEAEMRYPEYTGLGEQRVESDTGDLEAIAGTEAELTFALNQPVEAAWLVWAADEKAREKSGDGADDERIELSKLEPERFVTSHRFDESVDYVIEARRGNDETVRTPVARLRAVADEPPEVQLAGVGNDSEVMLEDVLELTVRASDEVGLETVGLFWRPADDGDGENGEGDSHGWRPIREWSVDVERATEPFRGEEALLLSMLEVAEGDRLELAARARDVDPAKGDRWARSSVYEITATSPGASLQLTYEDILRTEREIDGLIDAHEDLERTASRWVNNLEPDSGMRWDSQENLDALAEAMDELAAAQSAVRSDAGATARAMPEEAGRTLQQGLGMLADTEMVRAIRIFERVADQDSRQEMRSTLADARLTVRRTLRSLGEMQERYLAFREHWELNHMVSFTEMLAERQRRLAEASLAYMELSDDALGESQRGSIARRQTVMRELAELTQTAFEGLALREAEVGPVLADAFDAAAGALADPALTDAMDEAAELLADAGWSQAEPLQHAAGEKLRDIHRDLRDAQGEVARDALARLEELAESSAEAQALLEELREGFDENLIAMQDELNVADTLRAMDLAQDLEDQQQHVEYGQGGESDEWIDYTDAMDSLQRARDDTLDTAEHQLSDSFMSDGETMEDMTDGGRNPGETVAQDELEDVLGDLMEAAEELKDDYMTYEAVASWTVMDTHTEVSRATPEPLSATGATATTGNQPPPSDDVGGAARMGRLGARAHGQAIGDELVNRRGRDAQEGQENIPDQGDPPVQETMSDDPQHDESTGRGGREIDSDQTHFSTQDAGEWDDEIVDEMNEPQDAHQIVERQGEAMDPDVAERMRDTENRQEQVIERIKTVKKELDELYLPTDHLEDIMARLEDNLDRLREAPEGTVFREQVELLDRLESSVIVFQRPSSQFVQSVPREPELKGQVLDEKPAMAFPGYEEAVERYYRRLVDLEDAR